MTSRRLLAGLLLSALAVASRATADDARAIDVAKKSYDEGVAQYSANDVEGARLSFAQSYAAWPAVNTLRALALAELDSGHYLDALKHLKMYLKDKNADPEFLKKVPAYIERCNPYVGHLNIVAPAGAGIYLDGRRMFDLREPIDVAPGAHTVILREPAPAETRLANVAATETIEINFTRPTDGTTQAQVDTAPSGAKIAVTIALASAGVGGLIAGFAFGAASRSSRDDAARLGAAQPCVNVDSAPCASYRDAHDSEIRNNTLGWITGSAGILFLAGAGVTWFAWPNEKRSTSQPATTGWTITPAPQKNGVGLQARLVF